MQIASILSLVATGLIFAPCLTRGSHDDCVDRLLAGPSAVERFLQNRPDASIKEDRLPPLVEQAQILALYLNPPRAPVASIPASKSAVATPVRPAPPGGNVTPVTQIQPASSSPKFELHGISYYRQKPERSMALVLEPGGNRRWVHPGEQLGHLTIERIDCNSVVCRDGGQTQVLALAPNEALTKYARSIKGPEVIAAPKQAQNETKGPEVPPPEPGIRQMPLARVAALLGQPS
jgi:hypothetical protein